MNNLLKVDLCIIGAGSGGLSVAAAASQMGAQVALVEAHKMGGDCLNYGCVPSKSLLAAAKMAHGFRNAKRFGLANSDPKVDIAKVMAQVQSVIHTIAPHDSVERFEKLGVKVFLGTGYFMDKSTIKVENTTIKARYFVIATGSSPAIPPISGLDKIPYLTNETIFNLNENPQHLIIIGGGPIGCELAQAFLYLGIKVTVLEAFNILPRDEQDLVVMLRQQLLNEGLILFEGIKIHHIEKLDDGSIQVTIQHQGNQQKIHGTHLLVAAGRKPNLQKLNLEVANVQYTPKGIIVDSRLRSSNSRIFAIGDAVGSYQFTHLANYHAGIVIRNTLFKIPVKVNYKAIPWVTYTHPELAHVGLLSVDALKLVPKAKILSFSFSENDRAQTEHETVGQIKVIVDPKGYILGASILGTHAGELLTPWILAIQNKQHIKSLASMIAPYPTLSEINKRVAAEYYTPMLYSSRIKRLIHFLRFLG